MSKEYHKEYIKKHYQENKQYYIDKAKARRDRIKLQVAKLKEGLKCELCGEDHPACLDFHHRDSEQKDFSIANAHIRGKSLYKIQQEIAKCSVLCSNCHRKLHYDERTGSLIE